MESSQRIVEHSSRESDRQEKRPDSHTWSDLNVGWHWVKYVSSNSIKIWESWQRCIDL